MKIFKLKDDIYKSLILLISDCDVKELKEYIDKKYKVELEQNTMADGSYFKIVNDKKGESIHVLWIIKFVENIRSYAILTHEIMHLTFSVMREVDIEFSVESEEAYTYYMQYILEQALYKLEKEIKR